MKRIAFAAAAALIGTGCVSSSSTPPPPPGVGSINLYWSFQRTAPAQAAGMLAYDTTYVGAAVGPCAQSAVEVVTVDSPVGSTDFDCLQPVAPPATGAVQGVAIDNLPAGFQSFRLRGWRTVNQTTVLVYDTTTTLEVHAGMVMDRYVALHGVTAALDVYGDLYNTATAQYYPSCAAATPVGSTSPPYFRYEVRDWFGSPVLAGTAGCAAGLPAPVFVGNLELDDYRVHVSAHRVEDDALVLDSCPATLGHFAAQIYPAGEFTQVAGTLPISCP